MVDRAPPASEVVPRLIDFIGGDTLAAHNASFDEKFLVAEGERLDRRCGHAHLVCSLKLSRRVFPGLPSYKLAQLSGRLGIRFRSAAHRAEADAEVAAEVLIHIGRHLGKEYGLPRIEPAMLASVNKLAAAKVPTWLGKYVAERNTAPAA